MTEFSFFDTMENENYNYIDYLKRDIINKLEDKHSYLFIKKIKKIKNEKNLIKSLMKIIFVFL